MIKALLLAGAVWSLEPSLVYSPEGAGFSVAVSSSWRPGPRLSAGSHMLLGSGKTPGFRPTIGIDVYPGDGVKARRYVRRTRLGPRRRASKTESVTFGGRRGKRFQITEERQVRPADYAPLAGPGKGPRSVSIRRDYVVLPGDKTFYVLVLSAAQEDFPLAKKDFDRLLRSFSLKERRNAGPSPETGE